MFTDDDVQSLESFGKYVAQKATFNMSVADMIAFHKLLVQYNQITRKVNDHVMELKQVIEPEKQKSEKQKASK